MALLVVTISIFGVAAHAAKACAFLYPAALPSLVAAFKYRGNWNTYKRKLSLIILCCM